MRFLTLWLALLLAPLPALAQEARFDWFEYRGSNPANATLRAGPGQYRNPILGGFYPDPSIIRVGDTFYMVNSSFSWFPGIPVFRSKDLVHWTQIGNAIDRPDQLDFKKLGMSRGVFAPSIHEHDGQYYIVNTCVECGFNFVITARDPAGPWSAPVWLPDLKYGIDPSLFFDDDGRAWIVNNDTPAGPPKWDGHRAIWLQEFNPRSLQTIGPRSMIVDGGVDPAKKPVWVEGPHLFKKDGWYYLMCAEGGTGDQHSEVIFRSKSVAGPYLPGPVNPILTQRDLPADRRFPVTSTGHAELVDTPKGDWWAVFLGTQPYTGDFYNTGRETFLLPASWKDGWPLILPAGKPVPRVAARPKLAPDTAPIPMGGDFSVRDEFAESELPFYWVMMRNPRERWYRLDDGALILTPQGEGIADSGKPSFLARRQAHMNASASTLLRFTPQRDGDRAGLVALQNDAYWLFVGVGMIGGQPMLVAERAAGKRDAAPLATAPLAGKPGDPVYLRIVARGADYRLDYALKPGAWKTLATADGSILSTRTAGGFVGTMLGVYAKHGK